MRIVIVYCFVAIFRPICPLHRILHQLDERSTIFQLVDFRNVLEPQNTTYFFVEVNDGEGLEQAEEPPDEISERRGPVELELLKYNIPVHGVHPVLACSTGAAAIGLDLDVVEDVLHIQCFRFVVDDPVDALVEDDEKEGLELVRNFVNLARVEELPGRDELPCALENHHQ